MSKVTGVRAMQETFRQAAGTYELVNHVLTFGLDVVWRKKAARTAAHPPAPSPQGKGGTAPARWLDLCSGTGEMAVYLRRLAPLHTHVFAVDLTPAMLARAAAKPQAGDIGLAIANVRHLPFSDATFDLLTISFATRNINLSREVLVETFREALRVLRPGGRFVNLETSQPPNRLVRWLFHTFIRLFVRPVGQLISGARGPYAYLSHTIPRFYTAAELADIFREAGFAEVAVTPMLLGAAAIHVAQKAV